MYSMNIFAIEAVLEAMQALWGNETNPYLKLYQNNFTPTPSSTLASFTEATFDGYGEGTVAAAGWSAPFLVSGNRYVCTAPSITWVSTGATPSNTVYGWYLVDHGVANVLYAEAFPTPVVVSQAGIGITVQPILSMGPQAGTWLDIPPGP